MDMLRRLTGIIQPVRAVWVTTKDGQTIRGVMVAQTREMVLLRAAAIGNMNQQTGLSWTKMSGDVVIPADNVAYWQEGLDPAFLDE